KSPDAYNLLLQGRAYWAAYLLNSRRETLHNTQQACLRAIEKDPKFVDAYPLLAQSYSLEATNFQENGAQNLALAEQSARKAMELDPHSFDATMALGAIYGEEGNLADSCACFATRQPWPQMLL